MCKLGVISQERLKIEVMLLLNGNTKSYMLRRLAQQRMTLSDLEWPFHASRAISSCNNSRRAEMRSCRVASSEVVWEGKDKKRFRALTSTLSQHLEECYGRYLVSLQTNHSASRVVQREANFEVIETASRQQF